MSSYDKARFCNSVSLLLFIFIILSDSSIMCVVLYVLFIIFLHVGTYYLHIWLLKHLNTYKFDVIYWFDESKVPKVKRCLPRVTVKHSAYT